MARPVITQEQAEQAIVDLPPAGDGQREELKRRADALAAQAATLAEGVEGGPIDPGALDPDPEILQYRDMLEVPHARPEFVYKWVNADLHRSFGNRFVLEARAQGWEPVRVSDPDGAGLEHAKSPEGLVVIGDTVLMRIRRERHKALWRAQDQRARALRGAADQDLRDAADEANRQGLGVTIHSGDTSPALLATMQRRASAQQIVTTALDQRLRQGRMPGVPAPGR